MLIKLGPPFTFKISCHTTLLICCSSFVSLTLAYSSHSSFASSPTVIKRKHAKVPVVETLPLKPLSPEDPLFKPRSFLQALKGPFADKWMQTALAEVNDLLKDGKIAYEYDMPEALGDQTPIQTKIVLDIQIKPGQEKFPEGKVLVFPEQWQPWTPFALYKGRLVPERGWGGYYSIEVASSMPAQNVEAIVLQHSLRYRIPCTHSDIKQAFPEAKLERPVYATLPPGLEGTPDARGRLPRSRCCMRSTRSGAGKMPKV